MGFYENVKQVYKAKEGKETVERVFPKTDSLKRVVIGDATFVVGETNEKCESCKNSTRAHSVIWGVFVREFVQEGETYLGTTSIDDIYVSRKKLKIFNELCDNIGQSQKNICAIRVYTPYGAECLPETGDFEEDSVLTYAVLREYRYEDSKEWKDIRRTLDSHDSVLKNYVKIKPADRVSS